MKDGRCVLSTALWIYLLAIGAADVNAEVHREEYTVGDMDVFALTNGSSYEYAVVWLHGGGGSGEGEYKWNFDWWGDISDLKVIYPSSPRPDHLWFRTFKNGCGEDQDCSYNLDDVRASSDRIKALIEHEVQILHNDSSKVYLAGFSQGAEMTTHMQITALDFPLGGNIVMDGYPIPPLVDMVGHSPEDAKKNATYLGKDQRWMFWHGSEDIYFNSNTTIALYHEIWDLLDLRSTIEFEYVEQGQQHTEVPEAFSAMLDFVRHKPIPTPHPSPSPSPSPGKSCVPDPQCTFKVDTKLPGCKVCSSSPEPSWSCDECCASCEKVSVGDGAFCKC